MRNRAIVLLAALTFGLCAAQVTIAQPAGLFVGAGVETAPLADGVLRERVAQIHPALLEAARVAVSSGVSAPVLLNLFDDVQMPAVITWTGPTSAGYSLSGHIEGRPLSSLTLVNNGGVIAASVQVRGGTYTIQSSGCSNAKIGSLPDGAVRIRRLNRLRRPRLGNDVVKHSPPVASQPAGVQPIRASEGMGARPAIEGVPPEDGSRIDILVTYTERQKGLCGDDGIGAAIDHAVAATNQAYRDSGVNQRINLVHAREVDFRDHEYFCEVMEEFTTAGRVHALRDRYAADIVVGLFGGGPYYTACAYVSISRDDDGVVKGNADLGYAIVDFYENPFRNLTTFAHELGHVMGLNHDRYEYRDRSGSIHNDPFPYAYGYLNQRMFEPGASAGSRWWTIMSYHLQCQDWAEDHDLDFGEFCLWEPQAAGAEQLLRFSNPALRYPETGGDPMGVAGVRPSQRIDGPADAARVLNETARIVANYRRAPCVDDGTEIRLQASNGQYVVALGNGGDEVLADRPRPSVWTRFTVVDANGGCVESGDVVSLHTSDGFYLRARRGGGSTLDATAPRATPWARFTLHRRRPTVRSARTVAGAVRSGDFMALQAPSGHYVWAEEGGGGSVRADRSGSARLWGTFKITRVR